MDELKYLLTMKYAREVYDSGLISKEAYSAFNAKMMEKYHPKTSDLLTRIDGVI